MLLHWSQPRPCHCLKLLLLRNPSSILTLASLLFLSSLNLFVLQYPNCSSLSGFPGLLSDAAWNPQLISIIGSYWELSTSWFFLCIFSTVHPFQLVWQSPLFFCTVRRLHNLAQWWWLHEKLIPGIFWGSQCYLVGLLFSQVSSFPTPLCWQFLTSHLSSQPHIPMTFNHWNWDVVSFLF